MSLAQSFLHGPPPFMLPFPLQVTVCYIILPGFTFFLIDNSVCNYLNQFHFICLLIYLLFFVYLPSPLTALLGALAGLLILSSIYKKKKNAQQQGLTV